MDTQKKKGTRVPMQTARDEPRGPQLILPYMPRNNHPVAHVQAWSLQCAGLKQDGARILESRREIVDPNLLQNLNLSRE